jgi:hypothetical protein
MQQPGNFNDAQSNSTGPDDPEQLIKLETRQEHDSEGSEL